MSTISFENDVDTLGLVTTPDEGFYNSEFENKLWEECKKMGVVLYNYITYTKDRRVPNSNWLASVIYAFSTVSYKYDKTYNKSEFLSFWRPKILETNKAIRVKLPFYISPIDRAIGGLRELHEQGKVPKIIWNPRAYASKYDHTPRTPMVKVKEFGNKILYTGLGIGAVYLFAPAIISALIKNRK